MALFPFTATIQYFFAHSIAFLLVSKRIFVRRRFFFFLSSIPRTRILDVRNFSFEHQRENIRWHQMAESESTINGFPFFIFDIYSGLSIDNGHIVLIPLNSLSHIDNSHMIHSPPINKHQHDRCQWNIVLILLLRSLSPFPLSFTYIFDIAIGSNITSLSEVTLVFTYKNISVQFHIFSEMLSLFRGISSKITPNASILSNLCSSNFQFHTNATLNKDPKKFLEYNDVVFPPQTEDEVPRGAVS